MATLSHGVNASEVPTSITSPNEAASGIPFIVGTAPINTADTANVNKVGLYYTYDEAVKACGYVPPVMDNASKLEKYEYTICEFLKSHFSLFAVAPVLIVNVLDPAKHKKTATTTSVTLDTKSGMATIAETGILSAGFVLDSYEKDTDYILTYDDDGKMVVTSLKNDNGEFKCATGKSLTITAEKIDPSAVTADDIVGGVDVDGNYSGFELVEQCFPKFLTIPDTLLAPGYSQIPTVAAVMNAKAQAINDLFEANTLNDIPTADGLTYTEAPAWKNNNNYSSRTQLVCYGNPALDGVFYHQSTQLAGLIAQTDSNNGNMPYVSPSNKNYQMNACVLENGKEVRLTPAQAAYLNENGIITPLNFIGGWKCWGGQTACYPANTDVKDADIAVRRMMNWMKKTLILTYWQKVDNPLNRRQIDTVIDSVNIWLNGLQARGILLGGRCEFLESENPTTDLLDGISRFHFYGTPAPTNKRIDFICEFDVNYLKNLFA